MSQSLSFLWFSKKCVGFTLSFILFLCFYKEIVLSFAEKKQPSEKHRHLFTQTKRLKQINTNDGKSQLAFP